MTHAAGFGTDVGERVPHAATAASTLPLAAADERARHVEIALALEIEIEHRLEAEQQLREAIVERRQAEAAGRAREQELRDALELEQRTRAAVEAANRAKAQFLAGKRHELRTPLNAIAGYAELLTLEIRGPITADQREYLTRIRASQQHLLTLVNDVLSFARLEAGRVEPPLRSVATDATLQPLDSPVAPQSGERA